MKIVVKIIANKKPQAEQAQQASLFLYFQSFHHTLYLNSPYLKYANST